MNSREKTIVMRVLFVILVLALTAGLVALGTVLNTDASYPVPLEPGVQAVPEDADSPLEVSEMPEDAYMPVRLTFAGSCTPGSMLGSDSYGTFNELFASEGSAYFLEPLREIFLADDVTVSVCDAVLSDAAERTPAARGAAAWYRGSADAARIYADGGVDVLSLHAYHSWDYGADGYNDTAAALENAGLAWCDHGKAFYYEKEGIAAALYCRYADDESDTEAVLAWLENAENYDFTAVYIVTPPTGSYLPDESRQTMFRAFAEAGADLVVGTDTERIQPCEVWGESRIVYSLGALIDGKNKYPETYTLVFGAELQVIDGELRNVEYSLLPCRTYDDDHPWRPLPAEDEAELRTVSEFLSGKRDTPYSEG